MTAPATTLTWTGALSSDWNTAGNWSPAQVPTNVDTPIINSGTVAVAPNSQFAILNFNGGYIIGPVVISAGAVRNWAAGRLNQGSSLVVTSNALLNLTTTGEKELVTNLPVSPTRVTDVNAVGLVRLYRVIAAP